MPKRLTRSGLLLLAALCLPCLLPARAAAWGGAGHRIVAKIAQWRLEQLRDRAQDQRAARALRRMNRIFAAAADTDIPLAPGNIESAAIWPDRVRKNNRYKFTASLHFVSIPVDFQPGRDRLVRSEKCAPTDRVEEGNCSVGALEHFQKVLGTSNDKVALLEALGFVVHFVGDLHQPLHNSEHGDFPNDVNFNGGRGDRGGNLRYVFYLSPELYEGDNCAKRPEVCTTFYPEGPALKNLHAVWDDEMIATEMATNSKRKTEAAYAQALTRALPSNPKAAAYSQMAAGDPAAWAEEAHDVAEKNVYDMPKSKAKVWPSDGKPRQFFLVGSEYRDRNIRNVDLQLQRAGVRLAAFLMDAFD